MSGFFITGTDTGVGKTFVTAALMRALQQRGLAVAPMKPLAAGTIDINGVPVNDDVALLCDLSDHHYPLHAVNPYCFREAIAPHIAAQHENVAVDISVIQTAYLELATRADVVLVEGAGGFLVPMSATESMALIPAALHLPVILVVGMRLGCLNHALLTVEAIRSRGLTLAGWVANTCGETMNAYAENLSTLKSLIAAPLIGEIARITTTDEYDAAAEAAEMLNIQPLTQSKEPS